MLTKFLCIFVHKILCFLSFVTFAKEVMFLPGLWVCEFDCEQDNPKTDGRILIKSSG